MEKNSIGIYIHIPFCQQKCFYCDFASYEHQEAKMEEYMRALCQEILQYTEILSSHSIHSIYFGGGTPSYLPASYLQQILQILQLFSLTPDCEITLEVNPGTVTLDKMKLYSQYGINRISMGLQSTHSDILKHIGRIHGFHDAEQTLYWAKEAGFQNVSVDLIYPLPDLTVEKWSSTLQQFKRWKQDNLLQHVSIYNLEVHEGTKLAFLLKEGFLSLPEEEQEYEMRTLLLQQMEEMGFAAYEISNFALPGYESQHNLTYWNQEPYLGFGVSAASFFGGSRYQNITSLPLYIKNIEEGDSVIAEKEDLDQLALMKEYMILKLRLAEGVNSSSFYRRFHRELFSLFGAEMEYLLQNKLILLAGENYYLSKRGKEVANLVWEKFI